MSDAHRIAPKLWIGSAPYDLDGPFDAVVLCAREIQDIKLPPAVHVVRAPMDDNHVGPTKREIQTAVSAAHTVAELRRRDKRVLVTCAQGVNRSSLVAALAMMIEGHTARGAIRQIRARRRPPIGMMPLSNPHFVKLILTLEKSRGRVRVRQPS